MTTEKRIGYQSYINKSLKECDLTNIDEVASGLYKKFLQSEEALNYITYKYVRVKELLLEITIEDNLFHSPKQEKNRKAKEIVKPSDEIREEASERLNYLSF